jgi:HEAT repeat protein
MRKSVAFVLTALVLLTTRYQAEAQFAVDKKPDKKPSTAIIEGKSLEEWAKDLKDKDPYVRENAIHMLKVFGSGARDYAPQIIFALGDKDISIRVNAAITLGFIGMDDEARSKGINALIRLLGDPQGIVRYQAAQALNRLGRDATPAVRALLTTLRDQQSWEIRRAAAAALGTAGFDPAGGPDRQVLRDLGEALNDHCVEVRVETVKALIVLGIPGVAADKAAEEKNLTYLIARDKQPRVAIWARVAWLRINPLTTKVVESGARSSAEKTDKHEEYLAAIGKYLRNPDYQVRLTAAQALAVIGRDAKSRIPDLIDLLENEKEPQILGPAIVAVGMIGPAGGDKALPSLKKLQNFPSEGVRNAVTEAINKIQGGQ